MTWLIIFLIPVLFINWNVPEEYAYYKMEKVLGKVKDYSLYDIGKVTIQKVKGNLVWIAPIEYKDVFK